MKAKRWHNEVKVGLMVIIGLSLLSVLLLKASRWQPSINNQYIKIRFDNVGGLVKNAQVSMYGMEIGKVTSIDLMGDWVQVTAQIDKKVKIREGYRIVIDVIGIIGEKYIEIINGPLTNKLTNDDPLIGTSPPSIGDILIQVNDIAKRSSDALNLAKNAIIANQDNVRSSIKDAREFIGETKDIVKKTINDLNILLANINKITGGKETDVAQTITELKKLVTELNKDRSRILPAVQSMTESINSIINVSSPIVAGSLENLRKSSEEVNALTKKIDGYVDDLNKSISELMTQVDGIADSSDQKLQKALIDFNRASALLNNVLDRADYIIEEVEKGNGTLGKLVKSEDSYKQINETIAVSKSAIGKVNDATDRINKKLNYFDGIDMRAEYQLGYNSLSESLQNKVNFSILPKSPYTYTAGLFMKGNDVKYDILAGRRFGNLTIRGGFIKSKAGLGLDYWLIPNRAGLSIDGVGITHREPEVDVDASVRVFRDWYLLFGAEDITSSEPGINVGIKAVFK
ncbi:TPA: MCE family protein [Candidatus Poribacteria bacterium]|nr:MCE family protein [Candidatus Poribacteria bacterium]